MKDIVRFIRALNDKGIYLFVKDSKLRARIDGDPISEELSKEISINKELIIRYLEDVYYPLSFAQERLWFMDQYDHNASYNIPMAIRLFGALNIEVLEKTLLAIVSRHEVLRTNFVTINNGAKQVIHESATSRLEIVNLSHLSKEAADSQILGSIHKESQKPFDLANDSLIRFILYTISEEESVLFMNQHHIVSDGWSFSILINEITQIYEAYSNGKPSPLTDLPIQYADYAIWQRAYLEGERLQKQADYWKDKLEGVAILELPTDKPRPKEQTFNGNRLPIHLNKALTEKLQQLSRENDATLFMTLLSVFKILLQRYTGQSDICVGSPIANRTRAEIEPLIGFFVNTLALRSDVATDLPFNKFLKNVRSTTLEAYESQDIPFEKVVDIVEPERNLSYSPLFQAMMVLQNNPEGELKFSGLNIEPVVIESVVSKFDITLDFIETVEGLYGSIEYNTDLFDRATIERMANHFIVLVEQVTENPGRQIKDLEVLTSEEKHQLLVEWNDTDVDYPREKCIHQLFEDQVGKTPANIAVVFEDNQLTYNELNEKSNQLAHYLQERGVKPETLVGICVDRSLEMIIGLLGILKAGGAYVPIDPAYPEDRISYMLEDAGCDIVLTQGHVGLAQPHREVINLDSDWDKIGKRPTENVRSGVKSDNLAYVIYTSGSTGKPKGTLIEHKSVTRLVSNGDFNFLRNPKVVLQYATISFDASIFEIWGSLCNGSQLIVCPPRNLGIDELGQIIKQFKIEVLWLTSGLFSLVVENGITMLEDVKYLLAGGDVLNKNHVARVLETHKSMTVINGYGPTESTTFASLYFMTQQSAINASVPIGKPLDNTKLYVLDNNQRLVPTGVKGELYISGDGLARGYLNQPELTAEQFIKNPFSEDRTSRLYKTGDLARYLPDGNIEFLGRIDDQVKIRGFRIELGEIESVLNTQEGVNTSVVLAKEVSDGNKQLVAYIVPSRDTENDASLNIKELREELSKTLPDYMVPSLFVRLDAMPLTSNGKVDKKALPEPEGNLETTNDYVAPVKENEKKLAGIWQELLGVERVGIYDNFFELGGDSIISIQVVSRANQQGLIISPKDVFKYQTVSTLAKVCGAKKTEIKAEQSFVKGEVGLTPIQSWYFGNNLANKDHFNQAVILQVEESLEVQMLENALNAIFRQHDVLRLFYKYENNRWLQEHKEFSILKLDVIDLTGKSGTELSKEIDKEATKIQAGLSIGRGEIFKPLLFKTAPGQANHLLLVIHHLAVDGVSWRILIEDIRKSCEQQIEGRSINLGSKTSSFKQWFERLNDYAHSDELSKELPFWKSIAEEPVMRLPIDKNEGENTVGSAANVSINLSKELTRSLLQDAGKAYNTRINDLLLSALGITISKWIRENDIIINLEGHGREELFADMDISRTVGWFTSLFPVCISLNGTTDIGDIIKSVKEQLRALPNKGIGYGILRYLKEDDAIRNSVKLKSEPEISFNYLGQFNELEKSDEQTIISISGESSGQSVCPTNQRSNIIDINSIVSNGELVLTWSYSENLHSRKTIEALASNYVSELTTIIEHCLLPASGAFTPSDFPLCRLSQEELDKYVIADTSIDAIENIYPLSPMQEGMLFHSLYSPTSEVYVTQLSVDLVGELDPVIFQKAWQHIIATHSILRTSFVIGGVSTPLQRVHKAVNCDIIPLDYSDLGKGDWDRNIEALMESDRKKGFDFTKAPLSRFRLIKLTDSRHTFAWTHHHMLMDGWSVPIIFKELFQNYQAFSNDKSLPIKLDKYEDLIAHLAAKDKTKSEQFWKTYLKGFMTPTEISVADNLHKADETDSYNRRGIQLSKQETKSLQEFAKKHRLTVNTLVQGAWAKILQVYSGEENVVFGMTVSGRPVELEGAEEKVGLFINTLPLRINAGNNITVLKWLETIQEQQLLVREHEYMPLVEIQSLSSVSNNGQLFSSILVFENYPIGNTSEGAGVPIRIDRVRSFEKTNYPLTISASLIDQLTIEFSYNQSVYKLGTIERVLGQLKEVLKNIVKNSNELISNIEVLTPEEKHQLLVEWNDTDVDYPREKCIHHLFEDQVGKTPANIAVVFEDNQLTYNELNEKSNQLAHYLQERGVKPETLVGICVDRSLEMIIGLLAILKAGGAYVPIDPAYPEDRISYMLEDAGCDIVLTQGHVELAQPHREVINLDSDWDKIGKRPTENVISGVKSDNLAYVIYTSGSTGKPKGTLIEHKALVNRLDWMQRNYPIGEKDTLLQKTTYTFDVSVWELFWWGLYGAQLCLLKPGEEKDPEVIVDVIATNKITTVHFVPSMYNVFLEYINTASAIEKVVSLKQIFTSGEALTPNHIAQSGKLISNNKVRLSNLYGPTEATIDVSYYNCKISDKIVPIGKPISNIQLYIIDKHHNPVPIGVVGELCISGDGLARGYLNQPELTAEQFIKNPFSEDRTSRLYKTGDLARYLPDGNIEFLGRIDDQVKIRGFRIELGEIESVLNKQEGVNTSVVLAQEDNGGNKRLVAYIVSDDELNIQELREELSRTLPAYMVPSLFVRLDAMPLTSNGKVDKKALPDPEGNFETTHDYVAPVTEIEKKLAGIWQELLGVERVGIYDNFFELGGHSLLATQVISKIRTEFNNELPLKVLFESSTIQALSKQIDAGKLDEVQLGMIPAVSREDDIPLSFAQERLWFIDQYDHNASYNMPGAIRLFGALNIEVLEKTLLAIVSRHEVLRTNFVTINNGAKQVIHESATSRLEIVNLSHLSKEAADSQILGSIHKESQKPFDLANDSLIRFILYTISEEESVLFMNQHHIVSDGWSFSILINEITQIYEAYSNGKPSPLTDLPIQYADYAIWQRAYLEGERLQKQADYWKDKLEGVAILELPTDKPRPKEQTFNGNRLPIHLNKALTEKLQQLSRENDATLFMTLLSVFKILLQRYTGQSDICVGSPIANRTRAEIEPLIGFFVNTLALRSDVATDLPFNKFLKNVRSTTLEAYESQDIPFEKVVDIVEPERNLSYSPLFQAMMVLQNNPEGELKFSGLNIEPVVIESVVSKFDITLDFIETGAGLYGNIEYNTDLFDRATIERMANHFIVLVEQVTENPGRQIKDLEVLTSEEKHQLLVEWNDTDVDYPRGKCIHQLFEDQVAKTPANIAVVFEEEELTYGQLNEKANQLGHYLQERGVKPETLVGICVDRSLEMIIGLLGILKAGGAYVPIDPAYPEDRISYMLEDAGCGIVLTQEHIGLVQAGTEVIYLDSDWDNIGKRPTENVRSGVKSDNLAYVIYTSGSTGKPKGVMLEHSGISNLQQEQGRIFEIVETDVILQFASLSFDASVWEIFMALSRSAKLILCNKWRLRDTKELGKLINEYKISVVTLPPTILSLLNNNLLSLKILISAGEICTPELVRKWAKNSAFYNAYGPTENTVCTSIYKCDINEINSLSIGKAIGNNKLYVLDNALNIVPIGVTGELYISAPGLARGYLKRTDLTAEKFINNPFNDDLNSRLYRTGDLVKYLPDGNIEFLGRIDDQVKIRGFRIELGEIEAVLNRQEEVSKSVVLTKDDKAGDKQLVAYVVPSKGKETLNIEKLREELLKILPDYMVPSLFVRLEKMPLTLSSGKINKKALPEPDGNFETMQEYLAPQTETEKILADIWQEILGVERVGIHDNFFELGGNSFKIIRLLKKINMVLGSELTIVFLFKYPTIALFSKGINSKDSLHELESLLDDAVDLLNENIALMSDNQKE